MLYIYDTLSANKRIFNPLKKNQVSLYVCGVTVYDLCHIGHARTYIAFDVLVKYLQYLNYQVNYVRNITDVDDKIIVRAEQLGISPADLSSKYITEMYKDFDALSIARPTIEPKATEHIPHIIKLIETLLAKQHAYIAASGDVLFDAQSFAEYGALSKQNLEQLQSGARVAVSADKKHVTDFVLWKMAKPDEISWDSPWGAGRPGWHIECSAMNLHHLGDRFDIHGGGSDLLFPHHENEIAQSCCANDTNYVNTWMHSGMVMVDQEKMSKSLGNFFTIRDVLQQYSAETVRYFLVASHYRSQINYTPANLEQAHSALTRMYLAIRGLDLTQAPSENSDYTNKFTAAMNDDLNTPVAIAVLFDLVKEINLIKQADINKASALGALLVKHANILGILTNDPESFFAADVDAAAAQEIDDLIATRNQARASKDWATADAVRAQLAAMGVEIEDKDGKTIWRKK